MGRIALSGTVFAPRWKRFAVLRRAKGHALPGPDTYEQISALAPNAAVRESNIFSPQMRGFWAAATGRLTRDERGGARLLRGFEPLILHLAAVKPMAARSFAH